jgi:hypothetical protein
LAARVEAQLGRSLRAGELDGDVAIVAVGGEYRATLRLAGAGAPRELIGATCDEVVDALAFVLVVALRDQTEAGEDGAAGEASERALPPIDERVGPRPVRHPDNGLDVDVGVGVAGDVTTLPGPTLGLEPVVAVGRGRWSARAAVGLWYPRTANPGMADATDVRLVSGTLALCGALGAGRVCGAASGGSMTGTGVESVDSASARRWWAGAGLSAAVRRSLGRRLAVEAGLEAMVALVRPRFVFDTGAEGYRAPAVTIRASLTLMTPIFSGR